MFAREMIDRTELLALFEQIQDELIRHPAIDIPGFKTAVKEACNRP